ncbi:hypothetical protein ACLKA7_012147 [Drosophila subpalustris]
MCSITLNDMVNVTQQDLHDLLEIFEKKSFEAVAFEEGTANRDSNLDLPFHLPTTYTTRYTLSMDILAE